MSAFTVFIKFARTYVHEVTVKVNDLALKAKPKDLKTKTKAEILYL